MESLSLSPGETVVAVLYYYEKATNDKKITADREALQKAFYALRQKHLDVIASVAFAHRGLFPESVRLDQAISNMEASGLLRRFNNTPRFYEIQSSLHKAFAKYVRPKLEEARVKESDMQTISALFQEQLKKISE
jgi:hypothetical protein